MRVLVLDPKKTHENNPTCPSRLAQDPSGKWYCVDCQHHILWKLVRAVEDEGEEKTDAS